MAVWLGGNKSQQQVIACMFNCKVGSFLVTYLWMPIREGRLLKEDWQPIINRIDKKISIWRSSNLSKAGRLILINSVSSTLPSHIMSF